MPADDSSEATPPGSGPGELLLYVIQIRCYLTEDGDEIDAVQVWRPDSQELPPYKAVMGSWTMAKGAIDHAYGMDVDNT